MKAKSILMCSCMMIAIMLLHDHTQAQSMQAQQPVLNYSKEAGGDFTYKLFQAPNKMFGYDIFRDGKIIYHQGASSIRSNNLTTALSSKQQAEKAALFAIEKIKKNQPAALTQQELQKIIIQ